MTFRLWRIFWIMNPFFMNEILLLRVRRTLKVKYREWTSPTLSCYIIRRNDIVSAMGGEDNPKLLPFCVLQIKISIKMTRGQLLLRDHHYYERHIIKNNAVFIENARPSSRIVVEWRSSKFAEGFVVMVVVGLLRKLLTRIVKRCVASFQGILYPGFLPLKKP